MYMKTIKNILGILLTLLAINTLYSCGEDEPEYTPAEKLSSAQVYFPETNSSSIELSSTANSFDITIARIKTDDAVTVPLTVTGTEELYTVPSSVTFPQDASTAIITVTYDPNQIGFDKFSELTLKIGDENYTTVYGLSEYKFEVGIPSPWETRGTATFIEDFLTTFYGVENSPYGVEIQENLLQPGFYRLVNPFGENYPYNDPGDWDDSQNWYLEIHAEDPTAVYMNMQETGMSWSYGMFSVGSLAGYYMERGQTLEEVKAAGYTGIYEDGVITFPANSMLISMANYNEGKLYTANSNGAFRVAMPGVVLADYSVDVSYAGKYTGTNDKVTGVLAQINSVGEDVELIRLAVVEGTDVAAAIEGIRSGNIDFTEVAAKPATVLIPFSGEPTERHYTIVAVSYASNKAQKSSSAEFELSLTEK